MAPFQAPRRASARALRPASHPEEWYPRRAQLLEPERPEWAQQQQQERAQPLALARHRALVLRRKWGPPDPSQAQVSPALVRRLELVRVRRLEQVRVRRLEQVRVRRLEQVRVQRLEQVRVQRLEQVPVRRLEQVPVRVRHRRLVRAG